MLGVLEAIGPRKSSKLAGPDTEDHGYQKAIQVCCILSSGSADVFEARDLYCSLAKIGPRDERSFGKSVFYGLGICIVMRL